MSSPLTGIYQPRHPENTVLYQVFQEYLETWITQIQEEGGYVPSHVEKDFRKYPECGFLCHGFARARCTCGHEFLVAFSCKGHGICPSCNTRRMVETAAHQIATCGQCFLPESITCFLYYVQNVDQKCRS